MSGFINKETFPTPQKSTRLQGASWQLSANFGHTRMRNEGQLCRRIGRSRPLTVSLDGHDASYGEAT